MLTTSIDFAFVIATFSRIRKQDSCTNLIILRRGRATDGDKCLELDQMLQCRNEEKPQPVLTSIAKGQYT